jgi:hypothetical protein
MERLAMGFLAFSLFVSAAKKDRDWQTGKVTDSVTTESARGGAAKVDTHILTIQGTDSVYTAKERPAWHSGCLLVIGDQVKYAAQDQHRLYVLDTKGQACKLDILRQEKRL